MIGNVYLKVGTRLGFGVVALSLRCLVSLRLWSRGCSAQVLRRLKFPVDGATRR